METDLLPDQNHQGTNNVEVIRQLAGTSGTTFFITPVLILLNVAVFIVMCMNGADAVTPDTGTMLQWGGNFRPATLNGEPWRLVSNFFVHIGILHLVLNMYGLMFIGMLLEPILGRWRFLWAYLLAGVTGSIVSMWWHPFTVSAGASGAIFGMFGLFITLVTSDIIEKTARQQLFIVSGIGAIIGYNLLLGTNEQLDNAAHIGGFVCGFLSGLAFIPSIKRPSSLGAKASSIATITLMVALATFTIYSRTKNDIPMYDRHIARMSQLEREAMALYPLLKGNSPDSVLMFIQAKGLRQWQECLLLTDKVAQLELPDDLSARNRNFRNYFSLRKKYYEVLYKAFSDDLNGYMNQLVFIDTKIERQANTLNE